MMPLPPPTTGLSAMLGDMGLGAGPISSRTRMRAKAFQARGLTGTLPSLASTSDAYQQRRANTQPLPIRRPPSKVPPQRLVPLGSTTGASARLADVAAGRTAAAAAALLMSQPPAGHPILPPREGRARASRNAAPTGYLSTGLQGSMRAGRHALVR